MKRRHLEPDMQMEEAERDLCVALAALSNLEEVSSFLRDLCTPAELEAMADRWRVVPLIAQGVPYRDIHERTAVSVTTIGRVARCLLQGHGGYQNALDRLHPAEQSAD